ncbi:hypothetical protein ACSTH8_00085, partial [Vibrio parahaemolyticus]
RRLQYVIEFSLYLNFTAASQQFMAWLSALTMRACTVRKLLSFAPSAALAIRKTSLCRLKD